MENFYYFVLALAGAFIIIGIVILFLVLKFLRRDRIKNIITPLIFLIGGVSILVILIASIPSPQAQREYVSEMLTLDVEKVELLAIYDRNNLERPTVEIDEKQVLEEWASILRSCQDFNPNHPRYREKYMVILKVDQGDKYLYEVDIDEKVTDTADLELLIRSEDGSGFLSLGYYRCSGLFEFILEITAGMVGRSGQA